MKKILMVLVCVVCVFLIGAQADARRVEINLALPSTMAPSGTSPLGVSSMSQDATMFTLMRESTSGTSDFILAAPRGTVDASWSLQVVSQTRNGIPTSQGSYSIGYRLGDIDNSSTEWGELPLIPIISGVSTDSGATPYPLYFDPPPGKYMRFYLTSGTTPAYSAFTAKVSVTESAKSPDPNLYSIPSSDYTADAYVRTQPGFFHGLWVSGIASGVTVCAYDVASGTTAGATTLFPPTYIPLSSSNPYGVIGISPAVKYHKGVAVDITGTGAITYKVYYRNMTD